MTGWTALQDEVSLWTQAGLRLPLWWRDDDATAHTPQLDRLLQASEVAQVPVHLAVIPAFAEAGLVRAIHDNRGRLIPVVHGWQHRNHAPASEKSSEFGTARAEAAQEAQRGLAHLSDLFGEALLPVFVPPWNRIHPDLLGTLPRLGYRAVSTFTPRHGLYAAPGLTQVNTHLDPVDWRGTRGLMDPAILLGHLATHLRQRRLGQTDISEPYGLLTHHLIHDEAVWRFCADVFAALSPISRPVAKLF